MPRIVDKAAKRHDILAAAMKVFAQQGMESTKMTDIAQAAGIGKGTIYEYFRSKEEIFKAAFNHIFSSMAAETEEVLSAPIGTEEKLRRVIRFVIDDLIKEHAEIVGIMMDVWAEGVRKRGGRENQLIELRQMYVEFRKMLGAILAEGIENGALRPMDIQQTASLMIGALDGIMLQYIMAPDDIDINKIEDIFIQCFVEGLRLKH
jgi:AcrR family transcriptional regulator